MLVALGLGVTVLIREALNGRCFRLPLMTSLRFAVKEFQRNLADYESPEWLPDLEQSQLSVNPASRLGVFERATG